jgi:RNA polymerase sigma-70 factor, ECF subfamily
MTNTRSEDAAASFEPLRPKLMRVAYRMLGSVAEAEDVVQEAFIRWMSLCGAEPRQAEASALGSRAGGIRDRRLMHRALLAGS